MWPACQMHTGREIVQKAVDLYHLAQERGFKSSRMRFLGGATMTGNTVPGAIYIAPDVAGRDGAAVRRGALPRGASLAQPNLQLQPA
jgi:hypothetical protein